MRPTTIKLLEENIWDKLLGFDLGNGILGLTPKTQATKAKINKWNYVKLKSFCTAKEIINRVKRQHTRWKKILANSYNSKPKQRSFHHGSVVNESN